MNKKGGVLELCLAIIGILLTLMAGVFVIYKGIIMPHNTYTRISDELYEYSKEPGLNCVKRESFSRISYCEHSSLRHGIYNNSKCINYCKNKCESKGYYYEGWMCGEDDNVRCLCNTDKKILEYDEGEVSE